MNREKGGVDQPTTTIDNFIDKVSRASQAVEKVRHNQVRAKEFTESIAEFIVRDLGLMSSYC